MDEILPELRFKFTASGISREQVMMLDVLANNDWERPIYFSSPGGSEVALSLLRGMTGRDGYIKQNGMAFELSPLNSKQGSVNRNRMYDHLMKTYSYGAMDNPKVLTDYYARRHTNQYRAHFSRLAEEFLIAALRAEQEIDRAKMLKEMGGDMQIQAPSLSEAEIKEFKQKAIKLIQHSLKVMPAEVVIDYGEPTENNDPRKDYELNGRTFKAYNDGILHDYVRILLMAGDKKTANELGLILADQLESIITYFEKSDVDIAANPQNTPDLFAAVEGYFQMHIAIVDPESGDPNGKLAQRTTKTISYIYKTMYPSMFDRLKERANANGETTNRTSRAGHYASMLFELQDYTDAMAVSYGLISPPEAPAADGTSNSPALPTPGMPFGAGQ
jgi:hypothetical protein